MGLPKFQFQPIVVSSFGIIVLDSRKNKGINLYSNYADNKLEVIKFAVITSIYIGLYGLKCLP